MTTAMLTRDQAREIERLAAVGKIGRLNDMADRWRVPFRVVARAYADAQRAQKGEPPRQPEPAPALP
ncbi:MAG: hypothetical protein Q8R28_16820, partial [Dehalococcoidia bacterium]|nr:hypothetical protein [Dehalococcoidia bacterium]